MLSAGRGRLRRNKYWTWVKLLLRRGYNAYKANELNSERITTLSEHLNYEVPRASASCRTA